MQYKFSVTRSWKFCLCNSLCVKRGGVLYVSSIIRHYAVSSKSGSLLDTYLKKVEIEQLKFDEKQKSLIHVMTKLNRELVNYEKQLIAIKNKPKFFTYVRNCFGSKSKEIEVPRGIYIYGTVGTGKTMLMDLFLEHTALAHKQRSHFNSFMNNFHKSLFQMSQTGELKGKTQSSAIDMMVSHLLEKTPLICLDEFQVTNTADAMIIGRLFNKLWKEGAVLIATSNRKPDDLYKDGLQRANFVPFIEELKKHCYIHNLNSDLDYRSCNERLSRIFINERADEFGIDNLWEELLGDGKRGQPIELKVHERRRLQVRCASDGVAKFTFAELCQTPLDSIDYAVIASYFHTILIEKVPRLDMNGLDSLRRFITLIDILYDYHVKLYLSIDGEPRDIFSYKIDDTNDGPRTGEDEMFSFSRTLSRLNEMQTSEYLEKPHSVLNK